MSVTDEVILRTPYGPPSSNSSSQRDSEKHVNTRTVPSEGTNHRILSSLCLSNPTAKHAREKETTASTDSWGMAGPDPRSCDWPPRSSSRKGHRTPACEPEFPKGLCCYLPRRPERHVGRFSREALHRLPRSAESDVSLAHDLPCWYGQTASCLSLRAIGASILTGNIVTLQHSPYLRINSYRCRVNLRIHFPIYWS
ncbi:hypothetical protein VTN02DRAFT_6299 [Thermoascus thermophilus]